MPIKNKKRISRIHPSRTDNGNLIASPRTKEWITQAVTALYQQMKSEIDSPLIILNFPGFVPPIICSRIVALVVNRLEREGFEIPNLIINATR